MCSGHTEETDKLAHASPSSSSPCNIGNLVELVHRLRHLLWPLWIFYQVVFFVIRWESPMVTSCVWFVFVIVVYHMETGHVIFSSFMMLATVAGFGVLIHQNKVQSAINDSKKPQNVMAASSNCPTTVQHAGTNRDVEIEKRQRALTEFRQFMIASQEMLLTCYHVIESCQEILTWGHVLSPLFYASSFVVLLTLSILPIRWSVIIAISCVFSSNHAFYSNLMNIHKSWRVQVKSKVEVKSKVDSNDIAVGKKDHVEKAETVIPPPQPITKEVVQRPEIHIDGASTQTPTPNTPDTEESSEGDDKNLPVILSGSSVRDRAATAPESSIRNYMADNKASESGDTVGGHCFQCKTPFTSVLKRRKYCRHCGSDFCSKCCKHKLPRAAFGATAPAAQTEKELVCNSCFHQLTAEESGTVVN